MTLVNSNEFVSYCSSRRSDYEKGELVGGMGTGVGVGDKVKSPWVLAMLWPWIC